MTLPSAENLNVQNYIALCKRLKCFKKEQTGVSLATSAKIRYNFFARSLLLTRYYQKMGGRMGRKIVSSNGSLHSRGVMILFKPQLDVNIEK